MMFTPIFVGTVILGAAMQDGGATDDAARFVQGLAKVIEMGEYVLPGWRETKIDGIGDDVDRERRSVCNKFDFLPLMSSGLTLFEPECK